MPLRGHENILIFYKSLPEYHPQKTDHIEPSFRKGNKTYSRKSANYGDYTANVNTGSLDGSRYPRSIFYVKSDAEFFNSTQSGLTIHSTQKPVTLFEYLIRTYTNKGDTVLDNVIGSGTTAVAAYRAGRRWIGIEKKPVIFDMACERIERDTRQQLLFSQALGRSNHGVNTDKARAEQLSIL